MIQRRNNVNIGIGFGILLPMFIFGMLFGIATVAHLPLRTRTLALIAICANLLTMRLFRRQRAAESVRGVVLATVGLAVIWVVYFYAEIIAEING